MDNAHWKSIPLAQLVPAPWNYKTDNPFLLAKLKANLKRNGQVENLLVRELGNGLYEVVNGNHRYHAMLALGEEEAVCYNFGSISDAQAQRVAIETNETRFVSDDMRLEGLLRGLSEEFEGTDLKSTMPFSSAQWEAMDIFIAEAGSGNGEGDGNGHDPLAPESMKTLKILLPEETYNVWLKWRERCEELVGYDSDWKAFEVAIVEAMNIPTESWSVA